MKDLCASAFLRIVTVIIVALAVTVSAQTRPTPQPPPRRSAPPPRPAPAPNRGTSEPDDRGPQGSAPQVPGPPQPTVTQLSSDPKVNGGAALFRKNGCYECHANEAQGGPQGPRIGPNPIPYPRFAAYVRNPSGDMPPFTAKVLSDDDLASIYAFLQARPTPPPVKDIPLLTP
jgi:mono/diheme cytochrome c family protein